MVKVFIGGFPLEMNELELVQLVAPFADVVTIKLVYDRGTKICKGYGFIEVTDEKDALNAIDNLNGNMIHDWELTLNIVPELLQKSKPTYRKVDRSINVERPKRPRRPRI